MEEQTPIPDILTRVNQEKFRRKVMIASRLIAIGLIFAIIYIGWVQMNYAKEVFSIKDKYGSLGYCYYCGLETYRSCGCNYLSPFQKNDPTFDLDNYSKVIAEANILACPSLASNKSLDLPFNFNISLEN